MWNVVLVAGFTGSFVGVSEMVRSYCHRALHQPTPPRTSETTERDTYTG